MATEDLLVTLGDLGTVFAYKTDTTVIANNYNPLGTYNYGDYCIYDGALYRCTVTISTPEAWTPGHWILSNVTTELKRLDRPLTPSAAFSIPSPGIAYECVMPGITSEHILIHWGFSASAENDPPTDLEWITGPGYFYITNPHGGSATAETIKPVFALPVSVNITTS